MVNLSLTWSMWWFWHLILYSTTASFENLLDSTNPELDRPDYMHDMYMLRMSKQVKNLCSTKSLKRVLTLL